VRDALNHARQRTTDSPVFEMVGPYSPPDLSQLNSQAFRNRERALEQLHRGYAHLRAAGVQALQELQRSLGDLVDVDTGVLVELLLAFRAGQGLRADDRPGGADARRPG
jgi:hypothetical protein